MFFEELPDYFAGIELAGGLADDGFGQVLWAAGPGVTAALHCIENDFSTAFTAAVYFSPYRGAVGGVFVRHLGNDRR